MDDDVRADGPVEHEQNESVTLVSITEVGISDEGAEGGVEMQKEEKSNETEKTADLMLEEEINLKYVCDDVVFNTPSVKRKRNKEKAVNDKSKQLLPTQVDTCNETKSSAIEDSDFFYKKQKNVKNVQVTDFF